MGIAEPKGWSCRNAHKGQSSPVPAGKRLWHEGQTFVFTAVRVRVALLWISAQVGWPCTAKVRGGHSFRQVPSASQRARSWVRVNRLASSGSGVRDKAWWGQAATHTPQTLQALTCSVHAGGGSGGGSLTPNRAKACALRSCQLALRSRTHVVDSPKNDRRDTPSCETSTHFPANPPW